MREPRNPCEFSCQVQTGPCAICTEPPEFDPPVRREAPVRLPTPPGGPFRDYDDTEEF